MKVFMLKGTSKTGKTTTAEAIIRELVRRGYSVGSVKDIHTDILLDTDSTDTDRHADSGAIQVTGRAERQTAVFHKGRLDIEKILDGYDTDYVLLEGDSGANCPVILTGKTVEDLEFRWSDRAIAVSGIISAEIDSYRSLPAINAMTNVEALVDLIIAKTPERMPNFPSGTCGGCGGDCRKLMERILKGEASPTDCILQGEHCTVTVDGEELNMMPFVEKIVKNVAIGAVRSLKGYKEDAEIVIRVTR